GVREVRSDRFVGRLGTVGWFRATGLAGIRRLSLEGRARMDEEDVFTAMTRGALLPLVHHHGIRAGHVQGSRVVSYRDTVRDLDLRWWRTRVSYFYLRSFTVDVVPEACLAIVALADLAEELDDAASDARKRIADAVRGLVGPHLGHWSIRGKGLCRVKCSLLDPFVTTPPGWQGNARSVAH